MRVRLASFAPTKAATEAGAPALVPEMLASVGARYSRNDEGLDAILALVDRQDPEKSVDSIFKMVDYGHASIGDMAMVPIFMDGVSIWLVYYLWHWSARAGGQESSTRYIRFDDGGIVAPHLTGIPREQQAGWHDFITQAIARYREATVFWECMATEQPELTRIPDDLLAAAKAHPDGREARQVARMRRNFVFDRARYWIPCACLTNVMMVMSARDWVDLCKNLLGHPVPEAAALGVCIRQQLALSAPRLIRHATETADWRAGHLAEIAEDADIARSRAYRAVDERNEVPVTVDVSGPRDAFDRVAGAYDHHPHRYSWVGRQAKRIDVRYGIHGVAIAELRDLNRHRTGHKYAPMIPVGFYGARDQAPEARDALAGAVEFGLEAAAAQVMMVESGEMPWHPYWSLLGTQIDFEHGTKLDKLVYQIELRTGIGAHWRYADHMRAVHGALMDWTQDMGDRGMGLRRVLRDKVLLGAAEPE